MNNWHRKCQIGKPALKQTIMPEKFPASTLSYYLFKILRAKCGIFGKFPKHEMHCLIISANYKAGWGSQYFIKKYSIKILFGYRQLILLMINSMVIETIAAKKEKMLGVCHPHKQLCIYVWEMFFWTKKLLPGATQSMHTSALSRMLLLNIIAEILLGMLPCVGNSILREVVWFPVLLCQGSHLNCKVFSKLEGVQSNQRQVISCYLAAWANILEKTKMESFCCRKFAIIHTGDLFNIIINKEQIQDTLPAEIRNQ